MKDVKLRILVVMALVGLGASAASWAEPMGTAFTHQGRLTDGGVVRGSAGGNYGLSGAVGQPDACVMTGGDYGSSGGSWPGGRPLCTAADVRSCRNHDAAGRLCLDMGVSGGVEPRLDGIIELEIDLDDASGFGGDITVNCVNAGDASAHVDSTSVAGNTVTVTFAPALPDQDACTIELDCGAQVCVRGLEGDVDRSGLVSTGDASIIKPHFGDTPDESTAAYDVDCSGLISTGDFSQVKPLFGNSAPPCSLAHLESYGNSGCLPTTRGEPRSSYLVCPGDDQFELIVEGSTLHVLHSNAEYNCCPDDIAVSLTVEGSLLRFDEEEILTVPCFCICCYEVEATVVDLPSGEYTVEYWWRDYGTEGQSCYVEDIIVP